MEPQDHRRAGDEAIRELLGRGDLRGGELVETLLDLGARHRIEPFRACLRALAGIDRPEAEARLFLEAVAAHRDLLESCLGRDPGLAVAALDALLDPGGTVRGPGAQRDAPPGDETLSGDDTRIARSAGPGLGLVPPGPEPDPLPLDEALEIEVRRSKRREAPLSLLLLALDEGGAADERVMAAATAVLRGVLRDIDPVARILPPGFVVILPATPAAESLPASERLRGRLHAATGRTWVAGVASCPGLPWDAAALADGAREALLAARRERGAGTVLERRERRIHPRRLIGDRLSAVLLQGGRDSGIVLADLSVGGALLESALPIDPGSEVVLALRETTARAREARLLSRVLRVDPGAPAGGAAFRAAVRFVAGPEERQRIAGILADLPAPSGHSPELA